IVAMFKLELDQLPVYGDWKETGAGDGGWLKVPVAVNCTCPMEFWASALAGITITDCSTRFELEYIAPQPRVSATLNTANIARMERQVEPDRWRMGSPYKWVPIETPKPGKRY